jgi:putative spermidine/putrescine transport system substrate-binding protein
MWLKHISTPKVQAQQAIFFGETPANKLACSHMDKIQKGSCAKYHANAPESFFDTIKFWKTPSSDCGGGNNDCVDYTEWVRKWQELKG